MLLAVELIYLKRLIESIHNSDLPAVGLLPRIMDEADAANLGRLPTLDDDNALEVLRAQGGLGLDLPPQSAIFTVTGSLSAQKMWVSDRMRHVRYSYFIKSAGESLRSYVASGDIKLAYMRGIDLCASADILT